MMLFDKAGYFGKVLFHLCL